jgi:hypothetical protein
MNDSEFIELLNLYVDREISAQDALRLESEVTTSPRRREVYDQYCRMQKACTMLSEEQFNVPVMANDSNVVQFPAHSSWQFGQIALGIAAAAVCAVGIITYKLHVADQYLPAQDAVVAVAKAAAPLGLVPDSESMKPVFSTRLPSGTAQVVLTASNTPGQIKQLNWIGNIQMPPVFTAANSELLMNPKTDIKVAALPDAPASTDAQEPADLAAFRFQR